jgi:putative transposase
MSRQRKGSNRRAVTRAKLARMHARLGDRRTGWVEQTSTALVRGYDLIVIEKLGTARMTKRPN